MCFPGVKLTSNRNNDNLSQVYFVVKQMDNASISPALLVYNNILYIIIIIYNNLYTLHTKFDYLKSGIYQDTK